MPEACSILEVSTCLHIGSLSFFLLFSSFLLNKNEFNILS